MKKIAVISDIHGNIFALKAVVEDINRRNIEKVINLGDHISGPLWPKETIDFLMLQDWINIKGNHDRQLVEQSPYEHELSDKYAFNLLDRKAKVWLQSLPRTIRIDKDIFACHGTPVNDEVYLLETIKAGKLEQSTLEEIKDKIGKISSTVILCGHSHIPRIIQLDKNCVLINPGSVGLQAYIDNSNYPHKVEIGSPHARYVILEYNGARWVADMIVVPYNHHIASLKAKKNNRREWELALETGFITK